MALVGETILVLALTSAQAGSCKVKHLRKPSQGFVFVVEMSLNLIYLDVIKLKFICSF